MKDADDKNGIKDIIKSRRTELGLTQKDIAEVVGVTEATVSRWESGDIGDMKRSRIASLAKALKLSPNIIMGWKDEEDFKVGELLSTDDEELIPLIRDLVNMPNDRKPILYAIINDILRMDSDEIKKLKKLIKIIKSNILD